MEALSDPLFLFCIVVAAITVGISKSGLMVSIGAMNVPLLTLVMSARDAAGVLLPVMIVVDLLALGYYVRFADRRILETLLPGAALGIAIGWPLSSWIDENTVRLAIGLVTLAFVLDAWLGLRKKLKSMPPSRLRGTFWGSLSGFTSFISHTGGPAFQIYVIPQKLPPVRFAGTAAVFFAVTNIVKLLPYYFLNQLAVDNLKLSAMMVPIAIVSMGFGFYLVRRIGTGLYYRLAYALLFLFSLKLIWDSVTGYLA